MTEKTEKHIPKFRRDKEGKKKRIIDTFLNLVEQRGYANVSTNLVAEKAGISIGTLYNYFENKAAILSQGFQMSLEDFGDFSDFIQMITNHDEEKIYTFIAKYLQGHRDHYKLNEALDQALVLNQEIFKTFQSDLKNAIIEFTRAAQQMDPKLSAIPTDDIVKALVLNLNNIDTLIHQHLFRKTIFDSDEELIQFLVHQFITTMTYFRV